MIFPLTILRAADRFISQKAGAIFFIESFASLCRSNSRGDNQVANFYENKREQTLNWEDVGGFNVQLLMEIRNAVLDVESNAGPPMPVPGMASQLIKRLPLFDFPDDEIG